MTVAGVGALSYRVYDNGILDAGDGAPYDAWTRWRNDPGPLGMVGAALQHMNQITERIDREQALGGPATFAPMLDALLGRPGQQALSSFRIGHPERSAGLSPRRPVEAVTR